MMGELPMVHLFDPHSWECNTHWWSCVVTNSTGLLLLLSGSQCASLKPLSVQAVWEQAFSCLDSISSSIWSRADLPWAGRAVEDLSQTPLSLFFWPFLLSGTSGNPESSPDLDGEIPLGLITLDHAFGSCSSACTPPVTIYGLLHAVSMCTQKLKTCSHTREALESKLLIF